MGTYRCFNMKFKRMNGVPFVGEDATKMEEKIMASLREINPYDFADCFSFSEAFCDELKWYDHEDDMLKLSEDFPDLVFSLEHRIVGESFTNRVEYYYDGMEEVCGLVCRYEKPRTFFGKAGEVYL